MRQDGAWFPVAITQTLGYRVAATTDADGQLVGYQPRAYGALQSFAGVLLANIERQQQLASRARAKGARG